MSDPVQSFEFILNKQCPKKPSALYCHTIPKQNIQNEEKYKPQDVISSVNDQLKAMHKADSLKSRKQTLKSLQKYTNSMLLNVNKLAVEDEKLPKQTTKFDTQGITDSQLVNIIEHAEVLDTHRGMTQEFETAFVHANTDTQADKYTQNSETDNYTLKKVIDIHKLSVVRKMANYIEDVSDANKINYREIDKAKDMDNFFNNNVEPVNHNENNTNKASENDYTETSSNYYCKTEQLSQVLDTKKVNLKKNRSNIVNFIHDSVNRNGNGTETKEDNQLNQKVDPNYEYGKKERTPSPIFTKKNVKMKKSPSPLVFNLDQFEHFESMALSFLESNDLNVRKHVINSQLLNTELSFNVNENMDQDDSNIASPVPHDIIGKSQSLRIPVSDRNIENGRSEIDKIIVKTNSNDIRNKNCQDDAKITTDTSIDIYKDENLFSSDEEENFIQKEYQDLPFTCALETSFYNQSDVLDQNMYVGFQTASNRSIQVCADSFAKAKNLLSEVASEEITVTELVNSCDKNKEKVDIVIDKENALSLNQNIKLSQISDCKIPVTNSVNFNTANNVKTHVSIKDTTTPLNKKNDCENSLEKRYGEEKNKMIENYYVDKAYIIKDSVNSVNNVLEGFDEEIVQEFENIEMSLKGLSDGKNAVSKSLHTLNHDIITTHEVPLDNFEEDLKDVPLHKEFNENVAEGNKNAENNALSQILENVTSKKYATKTIVDTAINSNDFEDVWSETNTLNRNTSINTFCKNISIELDKNKNNESGLASLAARETHFVGFQTANNEVINISDRALVKAINIFKDVDDSQSALKLEHHVQKQLGGMERTSINQPSTSKGFLGFKTANNKNIKISDKAWKKSKAVFNNINSTDMKKARKDYPDISSENNSIIENHECKNQITGDCFTDFITSVSSKQKEPFVGFKSASEKIIKVSEKALAHTKNIFKSIDLDFNEPISTDKTDDQITKKEQYEINHDIKFCGFKTANNKSIQISDDALKKSKNIFKDIDSTDIKITSLNKKSYPDLKDNFLEASDTGCIEYKIGHSEISTKTKLSEFKTANNKVISIPIDALAKTEAVLKDLDSRDIKTTPMNKLIYPDLDARTETTEYAKTSLITKETQVIHTKNDSSTIKKQEHHFVDVRFTGFKTASNKPVEISETALSKSRKIFKDYENDYDYTLDDNITREKTLYPQEILQERDIHIKISNVSLVEENKHPILNFKGFQTASAKTVSVSKSALENAKQLFKDLNELKLGGKHDALDKMKVTISDENVLVKNSKTLSDMATTKQVTAPDLYAHGQKKVVSKGAFLNFENRYLGCDIRNAKVQKAIVNPLNFNIGFQTGNNKAITISGEALAKSKRLFSEIDDEYNIKTTNDLKKVHVNEDVNAMLDTQVLNHLEKSLHTEDFIESPKSSKRSGSPILSCPRAKRKKKFEIPYSLKQIEIPIVEQVERNTETSTVVHRNDYKKSNKYILKDLDDMAKNITESIDPYLYNFTHENLLQFAFNRNRNSSFCDNMTIDTLKNDFLKSVDTKLVPDGWLNNHLKQILWKLISYEVIFKSTIMCTATNVLEQLKYRYDKELYNAQRPALRKIFEKDDIPSKTMVLCVVGIYVDDMIVSSVPNTSTNIELLLTDGWYNIRCTIDRMLTQIVTRGKIKVGCKIVTSGAELSGCEQGVSPWEDTSQIRLKIHGNSTRRARWDARLGYVNGTVPSQLSSIQVSGGKVSKLRVLVTRVYPALYVEKFDDGSTVTRSERLENIHQIKAEAERQAFMEKLYEEIEKEFADQESQESEGLSGSFRTCLDSGSQIAKKMKLSKDPAEFRDQLTESQRQLLEAHVSKNRDRLLQDIQARVRERIEKAGVCVNRNVVSLLKIRVAGVIEKGDNVEISKGMLSMWKPNDAVQDVIKEGAWIEVLNVIPTAVRYSEIQISANRQSLFSKSKYKEPDNFKSYTQALKRKCYIIKDLAQNPSMSTDYNEIDTVGMIFLIDPSIKEFDSTKQSFQNVYLADADKKIICANFWGGLQKFGYQNVLDTGQVVACVNLQKRAGNTRKSIPQFRVTEFSYFTQTPKNVIARKMLDEFKKTLYGLDKRKFCQDCVVFKNNYLLIKNNENISPYRCMNNEINISKNKVIMNSPLTKSNRIDDNFNLTGLDFESTFKQDTQLSEEMLKRKKKVNEKIARLKMYGEPPPLSPMHIINRSKQASSSYKSPLLSNNDNHNNSKCGNEQFNLKLVDPRQTKLVSSVNITSEENTPQKRGTRREMTKSPVLLNRTYVKTVNPVKIDFDVQEHNDSNVDHFAEEFDGSPPMSLD